MTVPVMLAASSLRRVGDAIWLFGAHAAPEPFRHQSPAPYRSPLGAQK